MATKDVEIKVWRSVLGLTYIFAVAAIWIGASFVVQSVVDGGVSPFLVTYICNSLFLILLPIVEIGRYVGDRHGNLLFWRKRASISSEELRESEKTVLLGDGGASTKADELTLSSGAQEEGGVSQHERNNGLVLDLGSHEVGKCGVHEEHNRDLDAKGRWTRTRVAKVSLLICPFWFLAQLTFNLSLKYTTVTSNTIISSASSLFTFLVSLAFLGEKFTRVKLASVLLCMAGTIVVSLGDTENSKNSLTAVAPNPLLGDIFALLSAALYAVYVTLIRKKLPDDDEKSGQASMAQFLGFLGLFNLFIFLPFGLVLHFSKLEPFNTLTWKQFGLIVGKGLFDNVLSDYLWAKAVLLTTTTVATAGLTIQVPLAAIVDTIVGNAPPLMDYLGAAAVLIGFTGINIPPDAFSRSEGATTNSLENENVNLSDLERISPTNEEIIVIS